MALTSQNTSYVLDEVVSALAFESFYGEQFIMPLLYSVRQTSRRRERLASLAGLREYEVKTSTQEPTEDSVIQQYEKDFTHVAYGKQVSIERELVDDEEFGLLEDIGAQLGTMAAFTMEKLGAALFNDAFNGSTYKSEDNKSLCNSAHTNVDAGNSQSNTGTNTLNFAGVQATRIAMRKFKNYSGDILGVRPRMIVCPVDLEENAWEVARSTGKPDTANNNANMYNGMFDVVVWDFLTDVNAWFMVDPTIMAANLIWYQRVGLEIFGEGNLFTGSRKVGGYWRASHGVRDWRWVYGNNPS